MEQVLREIIITRESVIEDIQQTFNQFYPFLNIEFFRDGGSAVSKKNKLSTLSSIGELSTLTNTLHLNIDAERTISQIAYDCITALGLSVQILRKSGNVWISISLTDNWTLESQNTAGEFISIEMKAAS